MSITIEDLSTKIDHLLDLVQSLIDTDYEEEDGSDLEEEKICPEEKKQKIVQEETNNLQEKTVFKTKIPWKKGPLQPGLEDPRI